MHRSRLLLKILYCFTSCLCIYMNFQHLCFSQIPKSIWNIDGRINKDNFLSIILSLWLIFVLTKDGNHSKSHAQNGLNCLSLSIKYIFHKEMRKKWLYYILHMHKCINIYFKHYFSSTGIPFPCPTDLPVFFTYIQQALKKSFLLFSKINLKVTIK